MCGVAWLRGEKERVNVYRLQAGEREDGDGAGAAYATQRYNGRGEVTVMQRLVLALDGAAAAFARDDILPTWRIQTP